MYNFLKHFHSGWAYLVVMFTIIILLATLYHFITKKPLHRNIRKVFFYTTLSYHIQFLVGIVLYIVSPIIHNAWESGELMKNADYRLLGIEHPLMMFAAVILITIANAKVKRVSYVTPGILALVTLAALCLFRIPWSQWMA